MTDWADSIDATRSRFVEQLEQRGVIAQDDATLSGSVPTAAGPQQVRVDLRDEFPFCAPKVYPSDRFHRSWHREPDGAMCLYGEDREERLPWLDPDDLIAMISRWFDESASGWPKEAPVLDLNAYFERSDEPRLIVCGDLTGLTYVKFAASKTALTVTGPTTASRRANRQRSVKGRRQVGYVLDIGAPAEPPTTWTGILSRLDEHTAREVDSAAKNGNIGYVLVQYERDGHQGLLALALTGTADGEVDARWADVASNQPADLALRAGTQQEVLRTKHVLVLGAGALGSYVCDSLARAGLGRLTVRDHGIVEPGNLVRHIATDRHVGWPKPHAVKDVVANRLYNRTEVRPIADSLNNPREVPDLLQAYDLVIDATASGPVTAMLKHAAETLGERFISACLQENGAVVRVDVIPTLDGQATPDPVTPSGAHAAVGYATGCGDPVSLTPHYAVIEAGALTVRHAIGLLLDQPVNATGVVNDYR